MYKIVCQVNTEARSRAMTFASAQSASMQLPRIRSMSLMQKREGSKVASVGIREEVSTLGSEGTQDVKKAQDRRVVSSPL